MHLNGTHTIPSIVFAWCCVAGAATITIDEQVEYQTVPGYGGHRLARVSRMRCSG
jgi:hypothetical protein